MTISVFDEDLTCSDTVSYQSLLFVISVILNVLFLSLLRLARQLLRSQPCAQTAALMTGSPSSLRASSPDRFILKAFGHLQKHKRAPPALMSPLLLLKYIMRPFSRSWVCRWGSLSQWWCNHNQWWCSNRWWCNNQWWCNLRWAWCSRKWGWCNNQCNSQCNNQEWCPCSSNP